MLQNTEHSTIVVVNGFFEDPNIKYIINFRNPFPFNNTTTNAAQVYTIANTDLHDFIQSLQSQNLEYLLDYNTFFNSFRDADYRIYDPEMMLNYLLENDNRYILLPQLRADPTRNTGVFINNVHRFILIVSCKYPNRFQIIHVEGMEEPCEIVEFIR